MRLDELIESSASAIEISSLAYDSRAAGPGALFFCVAGLQHDGHDFAAAAVAAGAAALVVQRPLGLGVPEVVVPDARAAMAPIAARFHGDPSARLRVVGVTGTNGKTTTAFLVRSLLQAVGTRCGLLGTVRAVIGGRERPVARTTAEAIDLQRDLADMLAGGDRAAAVEVSSHALALHRADAVHFAAAIFTNLTRDHLDFHPTMDDYFAAKRRLFTDAAPAVSIVNVDDPYGRRLADELPGAVTFAVDADADYRAADLLPTTDGTRFALRSPAGEREVELGLSGRFNVSNALGALAAAHAVGGVDLDDLVAALRAPEQVPGRLERVDEGQPFAVFVDYAHTPDSLQNVLTALRPLTSGRLISVFGAGGDRDRGKRPAMGEVATRLSDVVVVTSDNPRSEDPAAIVGEILAGCDGGAVVRDELDRARAIADAVALAAPGDAVLIAGKGHESGQELAGGRRIPFDDVTVARAALRRLGAAAAS